MNFELLNKAIDEKTYDICSKATSGQVEELIDRLKPYINRFDYKNVIEVNKSSQSKMQYIIDIVQKGKPDAMEAFLKFMSANHLCIFNFIIDYARGKIDKPPKPEESYSQFTYRYNSNRIPRVSESESHNDYNLENQLRNASLSDPTDDTKVNENCSIKDVHSTVVKLPEAESKMLENYKASVKSLFQQLLEPDIAQFKKWLLDLEIIELGTLSRCYKYEELEYELEKRDDLDLFAVFTGYPDSMKNQVINIRKLFQEIEKSSCPECSKKLLAPVSRCGDCY